MEHFTSTTLPTLRISVKVNLDITSQYRIQQYTIVTSVHKYTSKTFFVHFKSEPQNESQPSEANVHICQLEKEKKLEICKEALLDQFAVDHEINLINDLPVLREQLYEIKKSGFEYAGQSPVKVKACMCPTNPPLYLDDHFSGEHVNIYVSLRDNYADIVGAFPNDE